MDWYLDGTDAHAVSDLRREVSAYLRRHCDGEGSIDAADLVVSELLGNTVRHAAGPVWVTLAWSGVSPRITVRDLGPGFDTDHLDSVTLEDLDPLQESGRGLLLIRALAPELEAAARGQGMEVSAELPVQRRPEASHDPPRRKTAALPALEEARPEGGFGRESFLRALVVQLAQAVEFEQGPEAAQAAVAQVGADVGGQMEKEYRAAAGIVGRMTPEQMADCYVRLKHAIEGGFFVIEANEERIVLGNTRCPFGDVVQRAPSLCRMTSSVFGGIAARNNGGPVTVTLEERIAVGDPGCRVTVALDESVPPSVGAHVYLPPEGDEIRA